MAGKAHRGTHPWEDHHPKLLHDGRALVERIGLSTGRPNITHPCRNGVALFDMSFMYKFAVMGKDAGKLLNQLLTANVNGDVGVITYTQWLNKMGRMEAELTVTKLSNDHFLVVVATDTQHNKVATRLRRHLCDGDDDRHRLDASILDVTGAYCQINLQGPKSREFLQELTSQDLGNEAFPFRKVTEIDI